MRRLTSEEFIERANIIHKNKYDYSLVNYVNARTKVKIICKIHGVFEQEPSCHLKGQGCSLCAKENITYSKEQFIKKAKEKYGNEYDYSLVEYVNSKTKIKIKHNTCGTIFEQLPSEHLRGRKCFNCYGKFSSTEDFIKKANIIHKNKYDYSLVNYVNNHSKVKIICPIHGMFEQIPNSHLIGKGCPVCKNSKGELEIENYLKEKKIVFEHPKKFSDLKDKKLLSYDFYIPDYNLLIEYNGEQHYKWKKGLQSSLHDFHRQLHHDWLKRRYARKNGFRLLIISYKNNILEKLEGL